MAEISQNVNIEMLERLPDGTYKRKYPKTRSDTGVTFDDHLAEKATLDKLGHVKAETETDGTLIIPKPDVPKSNYNADRPPNENDDEAQGYSIGSMWFVSTESAKAGYICIKSETNNAVWHLIGTEAEKLNIYREGNEYEHTTGGWDVGYVNGTSTKSEKRSESLYLEAGRLSEISFVTNNPISLFGIDSINIGWTNRGNSSSTIIISKDKNGSLTGDKVASFSRGSFSDYIVDSVDVRGLSGEYYIRIHASTGDNYTASMLEVFSVYFS